MFHFRTVTVGELCAVADLRDYICSSVYSSHRPNSGLWLSAHKKRRSESPWRRNRNVGDCPEKLIIGE